MTIQELTIELDAIEKRTHLEKGYTFQYDPVTIKEGRKYDKINIGTSGAWMIERETGEIFNIKGFGVPDKNKKAKADIGNLDTVDPEEMHKLRYNYLR